MFESTAKTENSITKYAVSESSIYGHVKEPEQNYDLITVIMICLGNARSEVGNKLLRLLNVLFSNEMENNEKKIILQNDFNIPMSEQIERRLDDMCNLSKGVWEKGMEEGMEKGLLSAIRSLMENMGWSAEQAMDALKIPDGKKPEYTAKL